MKARSENHCDDESRETSIYRQREILDPDVHVVLRKIPENQCYVARANKRRRIIIHFRRKEGGFHIARDKWKDSRQLG